MGMQGGFGEAVEWIRRAGLRPTRENILVAGLLLACAPTMEDLLEQAFEDGLGLSRDSLAETLEGFRQAGLLDQAACSTGALRIR